MNDRTETVCWRIEPTARPDDPRWLDHEIWREVIVRAPTAAMARLAARQLEFDPDEPPAGNQAPSFQSAFEDEKLYAVRRVPPDEVPPEANRTERGIIRAEKLSDRSG